MTRDAVLAMLDALAPAEPERFTHVTSCCNRIFVTTGTSACGLKCPYGCVEFWTRTCPACAATGGPFLARRSYRGD